MDHIRIALEKAKAEKVDNKTVFRTPPDAVQRTETGGRGKRSRDHITFDSPDSVTLDSRHLEKNRVVSNQVNHPGYIALNVLRTRIHKVMKDHKFKSIAITSPGPQCGKTLVSVNLALSLARMENCRTVMVDLDLRRPSMAQTLGIKVSNSLVTYLNGTRRLEECLVKVKSNLIAILEGYSVSNSAETLLHERARNLTQTITDLLDPEVIIFDLPPLLVGDDAIGFLPHADCSMLVVAEGLTRTNEIDQSLEKIGDVENFLGYVYNQSSDKTRSEYDYY